MTTPAATLPPGTSSISGGGSWPLWVGRCPCARCPTACAARAALWTRWTAQRWKLSTPTVRRCSPDAWSATPLLSGRTRDMPDGIFCANDLLALGVMQSLTMMNGVRIPEDVALIGYDDIDFAVSAVVPLSSIRQPTEAIGRTAIELLTEELDAQHPRHRAVVFTPELVVRQSTTGTEAPA
ncbi:substrate-binding domain-containing protein [Arthrobacter sp. NA-172]|uniref:substrate-binding domain-containing protein n=1 Tax=Arthrobacter sp. NA-172 TaxID=3367524 RepID=UPI003754D4BA